MSKFTHMLGPIFGILLSCAGYIGHPFGKQAHFWGEDKMVPERVNAQLSPFSSLNLLAS